MFELRYLLAELRRRRGRTILTALGLGIGVALAVTVTALSRGLDDAQEEVLAPLTGVGTDMSVSRPISIEVPEDGGFPQISAEERALLEKENAEVRFDFEDLGDPGDEFSLERFFSREVSFPAARAGKVEAIEGVEQVVPSLSLELISVEGTVPEQGDFGGAFGGPGLGPPEDGGNDGPGGFGFEPTSVTGIEASKPDLGPLTVSQIASGEMLSTEREAVVNSAYAAENGIEVGDSLRIGGEKLDVVGVAERPIGGEASDVYVELAALQAAAEREGRINGLDVRADDVSQVAAVSTAIEKELSGAEVTTAEELTGRISGSLLDAKDLSSSLGTALAIVSLLTAVLIASLLTLSSVNKRVREIGTLKALGWRRSKVLRQIGGESLAQGLLGGAIGVAIGIGATALIGAIGISLEATASSEGGGILGRFLGEGQVATGATEVTLDAPLDGGLLLIAVVLAVLGGLIAGVVGGLRAARMRPAEALRSLE